MAVEMLGELPFVKLCNKLLHRHQSVTTTTATTPSTPVLPETAPALAPTPTVGATRATYATPTTPAGHADSLKPAKKRRFIQFCFEMMGRPPEVYPNDEPCWDGKNGTINQIHDILGLHNSRSRQQIRRVLKYVTDEFNKGNADVDAGVKLAAHFSGRKRKLSDEMDRCVGKSLSMGFGLEMTTSIVNHKLGDGKEVCLSTVRNSAKTAFGGKCHNRANKKTGSRDASTPWAIGRHGMSLQLQQQFRKDVNGPSMIGKVVVKLFDGVPYIGKITRYTPDEDGDLYHVIYEDGDSEDLEFGELRVDEWRPLDRRQVLWLDEKHKMVIIGAANRHEWLFFVDPDNPEVFLAKKDGGVLMEECPNTKAKYMKECRGMFGVLMKQRGDSLVGERISPYNYTLKKVVGPAKYEKLFWKEVKRVTELKTTGSRSSVHWKDAGQGLTGGPYEAKFGDGWRQAVEDKLGSGQNAVVCVTKLMDHAIDQGNLAFADTPYADTWVIYHDALSSWWSKVAQEYMVTKGFGDRQIHGLGHTNVGTRYEGTLPGDSPEYMPLDSNLFSDLESAVRWNVAGTRHLPRDDPDPNRFDLTTPKSAWSAVSRTWSYAPTSQRIVQDIERVFEAIDMVVEARGIAVDFDDLRQVRHGRRLAEHQHTHRMLRRSKKISSKPKFGDVEGLHPISKRFIGNFFDLTLE